VSMSWHAAAETGDCLAMQCEPLLLTRAPALLMSAEHCPPLRPDHARAPPQPVRLTVTPPINMSVSPQHPLPRAKICNVYSY
jgi:hypothetical protein